MRKLAILFLALTSCVSAFSQSGYRNPVIPGYHPDPSVCCVGDDFYLVNSSFQYFPAVPIFHSRDLVNWEQIGNVLDRESQVNLKGASSWLGIYAPTIRYHEGTYYMITTNVGGGGNFLVTSDSPNGPWSEPVWLKQQGIDPSLYFENGRCYMVSNPNDAIMMCEIDPKTGRQLTESRQLWRGTGGRYPEGPHLYKKDGYYYLLISEGGTELAHSITIARSRSIYGPYEANPANPILTHCRMAAQGSQIQGTGHGDLVQAADGTWWMVFLAYRNFGGSYHHLGRETFLAPVEWPKGGWPVVNGGQPVDTLMAVKTLKQQPVKVNRNSAAGGFRRLGPEWVYLQNPDSSKYELSAGRLRLHGSASGLTENNRPTFVGRRQESPRFTLTADIDVNGLGAGDVAGLTIYQINTGHFDLFVRTLHDGKRQIVLHKRVKSLVEETVLADANTDKVTLSISSDGTMYRFAPGQPEQSRGDTAADVSLLSTEVVGGFTGVTLGMFAQGTGHADFLKFDYREE